MMGLSMGTPGPEEVIKMATAMAIPDEAKRTLADIGSQLAALNDRRNEIGALQAQLQADRNAADKVKAELDAHAQDLTDRDTALRARVAAFEKVVSEFEGRLAANAATLESSA